MGPDPAQPLARTRAGQTRLPGPCSAIPRQSTNCSSQTALAALLLISGLEGNDTARGLICANNLCGEQRTSSVFIFQPMLSSLK